MKNATRLFSIIRITFLLAIMVFLLESCGSDEVKPNEREEVKVDEPKKVSSGNPYEGTIWINTRIEITMSGTGDNEELTLTMPPIGSAMKLEFLPKGNHFTFTLGKKNPEIGRYELIGEDRYVLLKTQKGLTEQYLEVDTTEAQKKLLLLLSDNEAREFLAVMMAVTNDGKIPESVAVILNPSSGVDVNMKIQFSPGDSD